MSKMSTSVRALSTLTGLICTSQPHLGPLPFAHQSKSSVEVR